MIYLFHGADELARTEALRDARATIPPDLSDLNLAVLDGRKLRLDALAAACESLPFLAERRLVIVEDALKHLRADDARRICDYLTRVPETTDLIFVEREDVDKRGVLFNWLKKHAEVREFQPRQGAELQRWLQQRAAMLEARLAPEAGALLADFVGNDSRALDNELRKLANYVGPGGTIDVAAVRRLVPDTSEASVFAFVDALAMQRLEPALALLHRLLDDGEPPLRLLFMIGRQVRLLIQVKELAAQRLKPEAIAAQIKQPPFVVKKTLEQASRFSSAALTRLHDRLIELDQSLKTGRVESQTGLELLVAELCTPREQSPRSRSV